MQRFPLIDRVRVRATRALHSVVALVFSLGSVVTTLLVSASACGFYGMEQLFGRAWAYLGLAGVLFLIAGLLLRGVTRG